MRQGRFSHWIPPVIDELWCSRPVSVTGDKAVFTQEESLWHFIAAAWPWEGQRFLLITQLALCVSFPPDDPQGSSSPLQSELTLTLPVLDRFSLSYTYLKYIYKYVKNIM